jgi:hypothetical protein
VCPFSESIVHDVQRQACNAAEASEVNFSFKCKKHIADIWHGFIRIRLLLHLFVATTRILHAGLGFF